MSDTNRNCISCGADLNPSENKIWSYDFCDPCAEKFYGTALEHMSTLTASSEKTSYDQDVSRRVMSRFHSPEIPFQTTEGRERIAKVFPKPFEIGLVLTINRDGRLADVGLDEPCCDEEINDAILKAGKHASPFRPVPSMFDVPYTVVVTLKYVGGTGVLIVCVGADDIAE